MRADDLSPADEPLDRGGVDRLQQVRLAARGLRALEVGLLAVAAQREHARGLRLVGAAEAGRDLVAVHAGEAYVEDHHVGPKVFRLRERARSIRAMNGFVPERLDEEHQHLSGIHVVVDDEYALHGKPQPDAA